MSQLAQSPGKLILSGEHSVVYGRPALLMAIDRYATATVTPGVGSNEDLSNLLEHRHDEYIANRRAITDILDNPDQLLAYACEIAGANDAKFKIESEIPVGVGMGSSAAVILATLRAAAPSAVEKDLFSWAFRTENLTHGRSSGADTSICLYGGTLRFEQRITKRVPNLVKSLFLIDTGRAKSSTGETVDEVRKNFADDAIWDDFAECTNALEKRWEAEAVKRNHALLCRIGVVPDPIQKMIRGLEAEGFAAKICGSGAIRGNSAGMVLVHGEEPPEDLLKSVKATKTTRVKIDEQGTRLLP